MTENSKIFLELYKKLWGRIKKQIKTMNSREPIKHKTDFLKIRLDSYDNLSLNKIIFFSVLDIIVESFFQTKNNYYPQIYINTCEYKCDSQSLKKSQTLLCIIYVKFHLFCRKQVFVFYIFDLQVE